VYEESDDEVDDIADTTMTCDTDVEDEDSSLINEQMKRLLKANQLL